MVMTTIRSMKRALLFLVIAVGCGPAELEPVPGQPNPQPQQPQPQNPQHQQPVLTGFPCDVRAALQSSCAGCHAGAVYIPGFSTRADLVSLGSKVSDRLLSATEPMPPTGARQMTGAEREIISRWISEGLPAGECGALQ